MICRYFPSGQDLNHDKSVNNSLVFSCSSFVVSRASRARKVDSPYISSGQYRPSADQGEPITVKSRRRVTSNRLYPEASELSKPITLRPSFYVQLRHFGAMQSCSMCPAASKKYRRAGVPGHRINTSLKLTTKGCLSNFRGRYEKCLRECFRIERHSAPISKSRWFCTNWHEWAGRHELPFSFECTRFHRFGVIVLWIGVRSQS